MKSVNSNMINHMINDETLSLTRGSLFRFQGLSKIKNAITMWRWGLITPRFKDKAQQWHILQAGRGFIRSVPPRFYIVVGNVYMCKCVFVCMCVFTWRIPHTQTMEDYIITLYVPVGGCNMVVGCCSVRDQRKSCLVCPLVHKFSFVYYPSGGNICCISTKIKEPE